MANGTSALTWTLAVVGIAIAGGGGFMAGRATAPVPEPQPPAQIAPSETTPAPTEPQATREAIGSWTLICQPVADAKPSCVAMQNVVTEKGEVILYVVAGYGDNGQKTMVARAPLGIQLNEGLTFKVGEQKPEVFAFTTCTPASCDAIMSFDDANFDKLVKQSSMSLSYTLADGGTVESKVVFDGLPAAYEKIERPAAPAPATETSPPATGTEPAPSPSAPTEQPPSP